MRAPHLAGALAVGFALAGCGAPSAAPPLSSTTPSSPAPSPSVSAAPSASAAPSGTVTDCSTALSDTLVTALGGRALGAAVPAPVGADGILTGCVYGDLTTDGVQVADVPASAWALTLPGLVTQLGSSSGPGVTALKAAATQVSAGAAITSSSACTLFSDVLTIGGVTGSSTVAFLPSAADPRAITGQGCTDGRYRSILVVRPDLTGSQAELAAVAKVFAASTSKPS